MTDPSCGGDFAANSVATTIDSLCDACGPSMEPLEAARAVHSALVALSSWGGSLDNDAPPRARSGVHLMREDARGRIQCRWVKSHLEGLPCWTPSSTITSW